MLPRGSILVLANANENSPSCQFEKFHLNVRTRASTQRSRDLSEIVPGLLSPSSRDFYRPTGKPQLLCMTKYTSETDAVYSTTGQNCAPCREYRLDVDTGRELYATDDRMEINIARVMQDVGNVQVEYIQFYLDM